MNDDEVFIRAVVRAANDETARLIYADWLEERGDPRGAFVRAEAAAHGTSRRRPRAMAQLRAAAAGLDPVWVARVSRPPVGVCVDHLSALRAVEEFDSAVQVDALVAWLGVPVPPEYRAFLLNYNRLFRTRWVARHAQLVPRGWADAGGPYDLWFLPTVAEGKSDAPSDTHTSVARDRDEDYDLNPRTAAGTRLNAVVRIGCVYESDHIVLLCVGRQHTGEIMHASPGAGDARELATNLPALLGELLDADPG